MRSSSTSTDQCDQNSTRVDGVSTYNILLPHVVSYIPTLESLQEVTYRHNSFDAEQGRGRWRPPLTSDQIRDLTELHGSGFEYHTDNHLKAWPESDRRSTTQYGNKPKLVYNHLGGHPEERSKRTSCFIL